MRHAAWAWTSKHAIGLTLRSPRRPYVPFYADANSFGQYRTMDPVPDRTHGKAAFIVLKQESNGVWRLLGEVERRPGLTARAARARAILDVTGNPPAADDQFAVIPRSEWRVALDNK